MEQSSEPLIFNCNIAGFELMKKAELELRSSDGNKTMQLYVPNVQKYCIFETGVIGYLSYGFKDNDNKSKFLCIKKSDTSERLHEIAHYLLKYIETTLDTKYNTSKNVKAFYGFGDKEISFTIDEKLVSALSSFKKIMFKWTVDVSIRNDIVHVLLRVLDIEELSVFALN